MELLLEIQNSWNDAVSLRDVALKIAEKQLELAQAIAQAEASLNQAFVSEKEESFKSTDAVARARAKLLVGSSQSKYEYEFQVYTQLFGLVTSRISQVLP